MHLTHAVLENMPGSDKSSNQSNHTRGQDETLISTTGAMSQNGSALPPGFVVDDAYEILALIGRGGMGNVYRVHHKMMNRDYALKALCTEQVTAASWRRFQNEAQAIGRMDHTNIVRIFNLGLHQGHLAYYIMDLLQGQTLQELLLDRVTLSENEALPIFIEACAGIGYAHKKGIVHRDIKPGNILIMDKEDMASKVKILDFGIAKLSGIKDRENQQLTLAGEICGSPFYMSPEQCLGARVDARSDVYSLGCTLYEVLTGSPPLQGKNAVETMLMHQHAAPPSLRAASGGKQFPHLLESIVASMLAKTPMDRYQNMERVAHDLTAALSGEDVPIHPYTITLTTQVVQPSPEGVGLQPETKKSSPIHSKKALVLLSATSLFFSVAAILVCLPKHSVPPQDNILSSVGAVPGTEERAKVTNVGEDVFKEYSAYSGDAPDAKTYSNTDENTDENTKANAIADADSKPFSEDKIKDGKVYRVFHFPKDISIGLLRHDSKGIFNSTCQGTFEKAPDENLIFIPSPQSEQFPQYLKRFRAGDIYGVAFVPEIVTDRSLEVCLNIPGVRKLNLENCTNLTKRSLVSLYKYQSLEAFRCINCPFSVEEIIRMPSFAHLKSLTFRGNNLKAILTAARQANTLEQLDLMDSPVDKEDLAIIAGITSLQVVTVTPNKITKADLKLEVNLPHLKQLFIGDQDVLPELHRRHPAFL
jgi:serine/threonine protein kinase